MAFSGNRLARKWRNESALMWWCSYIHNEQSGQSGREVWALYYSTSSKSSLIVQGERRIQYVYRIAQLRAIASTSLLGIVDCRLSPWLLMHLKDDGAVCDASDWSRRAKKAVMYPGSSLVFSLRSWQAFIESAQRINLNHLVFGMQNFVLMHWYQKCCDSLSLLVSGILAECTTPCDWSVWDNFLTFWMGGPPFATVWRPCKQV